MIKVVDHTTNPPNIAYDVWFNRLKFCGCGDPESVLVRMRDTLRAISDRSQNGWPPGSSERVDSAAGPDEVSQWIMFYVLDSADLLEHGSGVGGSWLSDDGKKLLAYLETTPQESWIDEDDGGGVAA